MADLNKIYDFDISIKGRKEHNMNKIKVLIVLFCMLAFYWIGLFTFKLVNEDNMKAERKLYDTYGLEAINCSSDSKLFEEVRDHGTYVTWWELGGYRLDIMSYNGEYYGLWEDGSGLLLPKK